MSTITRRESEEGVHELSSQTLSGAEGEGSVVRSELQISRDDRIEILSPSIHGLVSQSIRSLVVLAQSMADFKVLKPPDQLLCLLIKLAQFRMPHLVGAFHLPHHQF